MPYQRSTIAGQDIILFGYAKDRTSWTIYNMDAANPIYWNNTVMSSVGSGFRIPANTSFTLKIPEDDPRQEVHVYAANVCVLSLYEGFGGVR